MFTRLVGLVFAGLTVGAGLAEPSVVLVALAAGMTALLVLPERRGGVPQAGSAPTGRETRYGSLASRLLAPNSLILSGLSLGLSAVATTLSAGDTFSAVAIVCWLGALGCLGALGLSLDRLSLGDLRRVAAALRSRRHRSEVASVAAISLVAFALRAYRLDAVPPMFHGDEGEMGLFALEILEGKRHPFFATSPFWGLPYLFNYLQALSMTVFGASVFGIRMLSVIASVLCIPVVYAIGRVGWGPAAGATAAWLMAVSHLHIHYSRLALIFIESALLMAVMMLLLALASEPRRLPGAAADSAAERTADGDRSGTWTLLLTAGLVAGLSQYFYFASRVVPIIAAPLLLYLWQTRRICMAQGLAFGFAFAVVYAPLAAHYLDHPDQFVGRLRDLSIFQERYVREVLGPNASLPGALPALLGEQIRRSLNLFVRAGDSSGFYSGNVPTFDVITAGMVWLGLGAALSRATRFHELALLLWFGLGLFFGSALTLGAISGQRILIMTTAAYLLGGVLVARIWDLLAASSAWRIQWLTVPIGTSMALWLLAANVTTYFYEYAPRAELADQAEVARALTEEPGRYHAYFLTDPQFDPNHGAIRFIARGIPVTNLKRAADFTAPPADELGIMLIAIEPRLADLREIEGRLAGGAETRVTAPNGRLIFVVYRVPPRG
jgi:4-amino-4-deoxy-L-arabinose transferase-like glycosyltransferase